MFIQTTLNRNRELIDWALYAQRTGLISPNTYVIDIDTVAQNAAHMKNCADKQGLELYMMTKQFNRNPLVCGAISDCGIKKAVAVSLDGARVLKKQGIEIGHLGHLVQIPERDMDEALDMEPEVMTAMDYANAEKISRHAAAKGLRQDILLRIYGEDDVVYKQQRGGISLEELEDMIARVRRLPGVNLAGFTAFPCFHLDREKRITVATPNYKTLLKAGEIGRGCGVEIKQLNAPGGNLSGMFEKIARDGVTHLEPGHAFTGTTYQNAVDDACAEKPAIVYLTEVSHNWRDRSCVFGGGFYGRAQINHAVIAGEKGPELVPAYPVEPGNIDYYAELGCVKPVGTGLVYAFRTQMFMTHSDIAIVSGLSSGKAELAGLYDVNGIRLK